MPMPMLYGVEILRRKISGITDRLKERQFIYKMAIKYGLVTENDKPIEFYFEKVRRKAADDDGQEVKK